MNANAKSKADSNDAAAAIGYAAAVNDYSSGITTTVDHLSGDSFPAAAVSISVATAITNFDANDATAAIDYFVAVATKYTTVSYLNHDSCHFLGFDAAGVVRFHHRVRHLDVRLHIDCALGRNMNHWTVIAQFVIAVGGDGVAEVLWAS